MTLAPAQPPRGRRFRTFRAVMALILREMTTSYGRSPGGYLWAFVQPIAGITLLSAVFAFIARKPPLGTNFPYFYATGLLPFFFFNNISNLMANSLQYSRPLLAYPAMTITDALLARFLLNGLTQTLVFVIVMVGIIEIYNLNPVFSWPDIFLGVAMMVSLSLSFGTMNCYLFNRFPVWQQIWGVITRPLFIMSGIFFLPENLPRAAREVFMWNPVAQMVSQMRKGFYVTYEGAYISVLYPFALSMILGSLGLLFLLKNYRDLLQK